MSRIFITGSSTGVGLMAGQLLIEKGHEVVLHGRNQARADEAMASAPGAEAAVVGEPLPHLGSAGRCRSGQRARPL
jgi:NAD(P)-dependent dehydrogenase (short-subunit alcohol dehydrogenase family)